MTQYREIKNKNNLIGNSIIIERTNEDGSISFIPTDPANSDYQRYLAWLENPEAEETQPTL